MLKFIKGIARGEAIDNIEDATITSNNLDGTFNIRLRSGAIKKRAVNMTETAFNVGDVVNITMVSGNKETAKIVGRSMKKKGTQKTVVV
jgi:hypothetical protein